MRILAEWADEVKMAISTQKSKLSILKGNISARPLVIKYKDTRIAKVDSSPYLGIEIDTGLTFLPHVRKQGLKARNLLGKIGRMIKVSYGASTINLNFLYKTVFLPIMEYAYSTWAHKINNWAVKKNFKETQRQVLISTTGAYRTSPL